MEVQIFVALVTIFSLAITAISALSYRRTGNRKALIVTVAFALFFVKGVILSAGTLSSDVDWQMMTLVSVAMDFVIVTILFLALIMRRNPGTPSP